MTPSLGAVLFDLDGTLIDSAPDLAGACNEMRVERGLAPLPYERAAARWSARARAAWSASAFGARARATPATSSCATSSSPATKRA